MWEGEVCWVFPKPGSVEVSEGFHSSKSAVAEVFTELCHKGRQPPGPLPGDKHSA